MAEHGPLPNTEVRQSTSASLLRISDVSKGFEGIAALSDVSLEVMEGHVHGLIGPNGAGKTTLVNCITNVYSIDGGTIELAGQRLSAMRPRQVIGAGVARTYQTPQIAPDMTLLQNIMLGASHRCGYNFFDAVFRSRRFWREERVMVETARDAAEFVGLDDRLLAAKSTDLPAEELKLVEIARAIAAEPRLLLLDEPGAGMTRERKTQIADVIRKAQAQGITQVVIEHDLDFISTVCNHVSVLDFGRNLAEGTAEEVLREPKVIEAYVGS